MVLFGFYHDQNWKKKIKRWCKQGLTSAPLILLLYHKKCRPNQNVKKHGRQWSNQIVLLYPNEHTNILSMQHFLAFFFFSLWKGTQAKGWERWFGEKNSCLDAQVLKFCVTGALQSTNDLWSIYTPICWLFFLTSAVGVSRLTSEFTQLFWWAKGTPQEHKGPEYLTS